MFTIPTIFSAIDKISAPVRAMQNSVSTFASKTASGFAQADRVLNRFTPVLSETSKQLLSFAQTAVIAGAIVGGITFSANSLMEYEKSVASFRTIVSDVSDQEFAKFQTGINNVAKETKKSSIEVAQAYEKIAGLNATFAESPEGIERVTKAVITLSKASGDELGPSAESLIGIMNQFNFAADQADRTINVLAAGAGVGAASITQTAESFVNFGSVAKGANITLEQSVGLIQTLGKFSVFGAEAGTKLRGSVLKLQQAGVGYKSGQFQINDALEEARQKVDKLKTAKEKDAAILKMFGAENIATGKILLGNIETFKKYTEGVTGTSAAQTQAEIRSNTLSEKVNELKASWVNLITGTSKAGGAMDKLKKIIGFVADHLEQIVDIGGKVLLFFAAWKTAMLVGKAAMIAYRAVSNALFLHDMIKYTASTTGLTYAQSAQAVITNSLTTSQLGLNAAMAANPIGIVVIALAALAAAVYAVYDAYKQLEAIAKKEAEHKKAIKDESFAVQDLEKKYLALGKSKEEARKAALAESKTALINELKDVQTGLSSPVQAERDKAMEKFNVLSGKAEAIKDPNKAFNFAGNRYTNSEDLSTMVAKINPEPGPSVAPVDWLNLSSQKPAVNSKEEARKASVNDMITQTNNAKVDINIKAPEGVADAKTDNNFVTIKTSSTMSAAR